MNRRRLPIQTPGSDGRLDHQEGGYHGLPQAGVTPMPPTAHTHAESDVTGLVSDLAAKVPYTGATGDVDLGPNSMAMETLRLSLTPGVTPQVGELFWDATNKCLAVKLTDQVTQEIGQEQFVPVVNKTGATIPDGTVVYISTAQGNRPVATPAKADAIATSRVIGVITENILNNETGKCTVSGVVNGFNTSGFGVGDKLYLSPTTAGLLTNVMPSSPNYNVAVAIALNSTNNGAIFVHPQQALATDVAMLANTDEAAPTQKAVKTYVGHTITKDMTGFANPELITVDYDPTTRKVTLTGTVAGYYQGVQVPALTSGWVSDAHPAGATQPYFLYYNGSAFVWSTTPWTFDMMMITVAVYDSTGTFRWALREVHGLMGHREHQEFHERDGTYLRAGGDISAYVIGSTTAADRRPDVSSATLADEDLPSVLPTLTSKLYNRHAVSGAGATSTWTAGAADIVPLSGNKPYWNQFTGGAWQQTLMSVGDYMAVFLVAVPTAKVAGADSGYRYLWLQGQTSGSLAAVQAEAFGALNLGQIASLSPEYVCIGKVIIRYIGGNWSITSVEKLTTSKGGASSAGNSLTAVTTDATLTGAGTATSPLAIDTTAEGNRIRACLLTGFIAAEGTIAATDTILQAFQKTEYRLAINDAKVSFPGFGTTNSTAARGDHLHSGTYEPALGNPSVNGYVLSSTTAGVRSWVAMTGGGAAVWGGITGTLSNQTDLQNALNAKASLSGAVFTGNARVQYNAAGNVSVISENQNTATNSTAQFIAINDAGRNLRIQKASSNASSLLLAGGPTGEIGAIFTDSAHSLVLGTNGTAAITINGSTQAVSMGALTATNSGAAQLTLTGFGGGVSSALNGEITLGSTEACRGRISMDAATGSTTMRFDSTYDSALAEMHFRFRTAGSAVIPLKLKGDLSAIFGGAVSMGALTATTATFTPTGSAVLICSNGGTSQRYGSISNTSGGYLWGVESSAGGALINGATGYDAALVAKTGFALSANDGTTLHFRIASTGAASFQGNSVSMGALTANANSDFNCSNVSINGGSSVANLNLKTTAGPSGLTIQMDTVGDVYIWQRQNRPMYFGTNGTTALTISANQTATFASGVSMGALTVSGNFTCSGVWSGANLLSVGDGVSNNGSFTIYGTDGKGLNIAPDVANTRFAIYLNGADRMWIYQNGLVEFADLIKARALTLTSGNIEVSQSSYLRFGTTSKISQTPTGTGLAIDTYYSATVPAVEFVATDNSSPFIKIFNASNAPSTPSGGGALFVQSGALKYKGSSGTVTTIANA